MESTPLGGCIRLFLKDFFSNFRSHIKDSKWGRKCISINCASHNRSPQQIPLQKFPFATVAKPHYHCRAFWAQAATEKHERTHCFQLSDPLECNVSAMLFVQPMYYDQPRQTNICFGRFKAAIQTNVLLLLSIST